MAQEALSQDAFAQDVTDHEALVEVFEIGIPEVVELLVNPPTAVEGVRNVLKANKVKIVSCLEAMGDIRIVGDYDEDSLDEALVDADAVHVGHVTEWHHAA